MRQAFQFPLVQTVIFTSCFLKPGLRNTVISLPKSHRTFRPEHKYWPNNLISLRAGSSRKKGLQGDAQQDWVEGSRSQDSKKLLLAGSRCTVLGQTHEEFKVHQIAVMTGSSLNHHRAATEHVSTAINHSMTKYKSVCLGSRVLPSAVHGSTLCCRGKGHCPSEFSVGILCSTGRHRISRAMLQVVNTTTAALSTTRPLLGSRISSNLWTQTNKLQFHTLCKAACKNTHPQTFATLTKPPILAARTSYGSIVEKTYDKECSGHPARHFGSREQRECPSELPLERNLRAQRGNMDAQISCIDFSVLSGRQ